MLLIIAIVTLVLIGLRLAGNTGVVYQGVTHTFVGALGSWAWLTHEWMTVLCFILLFSTELYMVISRFFPALAISNLLKLLTPVPPKAK